MMKGDAATRAKARMAKRSAKRGAGTGAGVGAKKPGGFMGAMADRFSVMKKK